MYLNGKLKISILGSKQGSYSEHTVKKYITELNSQGKNKKLELVLTFYLKDDSVGYNSGYINDQESFDKMLDIKTMSLIQSHCRQNCKKVA